MANSKSEIYIHLTWPTLNRCPFLENSDLRNIVLNHIKENALKKGIHIEEIGGFDDHVHCLIRMPRDISLGKMVQLLKGESSYWINHQLKVEEKFNWEEGYHGNAVPPYNLEKIRKYIQQQEAHHQKTKGEEPI